MVSDILSEHLKLRSSPRLSSVEVNPLTSKIRLTEAVVDDDEWPNSLYESFPPVFSSITPLPTKEYERDIDSQNRFRDYDKSYESSRIHSEICTRGQKRK